MNRNTISGLCWLVLVAMLVAGLVGCGLFKKSRQKDYSRTGSKTVDKSVIVIDRSDSTGMRKQTILELDIRIPKPKKGDPGIVVPDSTINTITEAITAAIGKATRLKAKVSTMKDESRQEAEKRQENRDFESRADSVSKSNDLLKDSNTSMIANIPWYGWIIGIGGVFLLLYLILRRYGIL